MVGLFRSFKNWLYQGCKNVALEIRMMLDFIRDTILFGIFMAIVLALLLIILASIITYIAVFRNPI